MFLRGEEGLGCGGERQQGRIGGYIIRGGGHNSHKGHHNFYGGHHNLCGGHHNFRRDGHKSCGGEHGGKGGVRIKNGKNYKNFITICRYVRIKL